MERLLLIDGNNLALRCAHAFNLYVNTTDFSKPFDPDDVMDQTNEFPTGVLHGVFKSLITLRGHFPEHYIAMVWDGGNERRIDMTSPEVEKGLIPEVYKFNRKKKPPSQQILNFFKQKDKLFEAISMTNIPQIRIDKEEADDVIASYVKKYSSRGTKIIVCTNDKDYYQLFGENVMLLRGDDLRDLTWFREEYGIAPPQWVDIGGLSGDTGDNIFGVPGWGETTSLRAIREYKSLEGVLNHLKSKHSKLREQFPDKDEGIKELKKVETPSGKQKYPGIIAGMPFSGVAYALEHKKCKIPKAELMALMFEERAHLALDLKQMYSNLDIPELPFWNRNLGDNFGRLCDQYQLNEIRAQADSICCPQPSGEPVICGCSQPVAW